MLHKHANSLVFIFKIQMQVNFNFRKCSYILRENHNNFRIELSFDIRYWVLFFIEYIAPTGFTLLCSRE